MNPTRPVIRHARSRLPEGELPRLTVADDRGVLRFERRCETRPAASGEFVASYSDGGARFGITRVRLVDRSMRGAGLIADGPIDPMMCVSVQVPGERVPRLVGRVVRCELVDESEGETSGRYHIGVSLSRTMAA
jgi:hypothetical protein